MNGFWREGRGDVRPPIRDFPREVTRNGPVKHDAVLGRIGISGNDSDGVGNDSLLFNSKNIFACSAQAGSHCIVADPWNAATIIAFGSTVDFRLLRDFSHKYKHTSTIASQRSGQRNREHHNAPSPKEIKNPYRQEFSRFIEIP